MGLPYARDKTFAPGSHASSAVLNDVQDQLMAQFNGRRRDNLLHIGPFHGESAGSGWAPDSGETYLEAAGASSVWRIPMHILGADDYIVSIHGDFYQDAGGAISFGLKQVTASGTESFVVENNASIGSSTFDRKSLSVAQFLESQVVYFVELTAGQASDGFLGLEVNWRNLGKRR